MSNAVIKSVVKGGPAFKAGIRAGDALLEINNETVNDIFDYRFLACDERLTLKIHTKDGKIAYKTVKKGAYEDLGIAFEHALIDCPRRCENRCIFCFIDQNPKGMRKSIYFKDDDSRLSFFQGNYMTLTNLSERDVERMIRMRISPINISVHTTNPELRVKMLRNEKAGGLYGIMRRFAQNGISMNAQIVLCPDINDKNELQRTLDDLAALYPSVKSVAVVPVGLTGHRKGLYGLRAVEREDARETLARIAAYQKKSLGQTGTRFVFASDELFLKAGTPFPPAGEYEGFLQLENGVGLLASLEDELDSALKLAPQKDIRRRVAVITGTAAENFFISVAQKIKTRYNNITITVYGVRNDFFGESVTVAGLLCGRDIVAQLKGKLECDEALISENMLRSGTDVLLDDMTVGELAGELGVGIRAVEPDGFALLNALLGGEYV